MIIFIISNLAIIFSSYLLTLKLAIQSLSGKFVCIGLFTFIQILLSELLLGIFHMLFLPALIFINLAISIFLISWMFLTNKNIRSNLKTDIITLQSNLKSILVLENILMSGLVLAISLWLSIAIYFLPPRGVDDLNYHLSSIYEYIQNGKLSVLPVELRNFFAYPLNAEFLFMWPAIFFHSQQYVDATQFVIAFYSILVIYALGRRIYLDRKISFFIATLFFFSPIVLDQAGSNYIDLITNTYYLVSLYLCLLFHQEKKMTYLYLAGLSIGLIMGMKYNMLILILGLQPLILTNRIPKKHWLGYLSLIFIVGGYWYLRNWFIFGNPCYPLDPSKKGMLLFVNEEASNTFHLIRQIINKFLLLYSTDAGLGSFHGGLGITFWGLAVPSWLFLILKHLRSFTRKDFLPLFIWLQMILGFIIIFIGHINYLHLNVRYSLFIVAIGLLALGKIFQLLRNNIVLSRIFKSVCIIFSILSMILISTSRLPSYHVYVPINDYLRKTTTTEMKYLSLSSYMPSLSLMWEALDYLTYNDSEGLQCYMATNVLFFWTSPTYGTKLQNHIWNFQRNPPHKPDAFLYYFGGQEDIFYLGKKIPAREVIYNPDYVLIIHTKDSLLFIKKEYFNKDQRKKLLIAYYQLRFPKFITLAKVIKNNLEKSIPMITSQYLGYGFKYFELNNELNNTVYIVPDDEEDRFAIKKSLKIAYTIDKPLENYLSEKIFQINDKELVTIYKNVKP